MKNKHLEYYMDSKIFSKNEVACVGVMDYNIASQIKKLSEDNQ